MGDLDLNDVRAFVSVLEHGGFAKAARQLRVPTSTISRAVSRLEASVGTRLLERTTRTVRATAEGKTLFTEVAEPLGTLERAVRSVDGQGRAPRGRLRVTAPNDLGSTFLADIVVDFAARYPQVEVELELTARTVNLVAEGFDVAVRAGTRLAESSLVARLVGVIEVDLYASVAYVQARGVPQSLEDLESHDCILFRPDNGRTEWALTGPDGVVRVRAQGRVGGDDFSFVRAAVLAGGGIGLLPRLVAHADVTAGRLVRVLGDYEMREASLYVVYPSLRNVPPKVAAFRDFVVDAYARKKDLFSPRSRR